MLSPIDGGFGTQPMVASSLRTTLFWRMMDEWEVCDRSLSPVCPSLKACPYSKRGLMLGHHNYQVIERVHRGRSSLQIIASWVATHWICTHTQTITISNDLCPPMNNNIAPMPTQNPWAWVGMGMGTQCRALLGFQASRLRSNFMSLVSSKEEVILTLKCMGDHKVVDYP